MSLKVKNIRSFLEHRGWKLVRNGSSIVEYKPPKGLGISEGYLFQVPVNEHKKGFDDFVKRLINILVNIYEDEFTEDDLMIIFSSDNSILSFRISDNDTQHGSIKLSRVRTNIDGIYKVLQQIVTFISTGKPIFGSAKKEVGSYLDSCRYLQTQKGSFITKFELPLIPVNILEPSIVADKLFYILDFIVEEAINKDILEIDNNYIEEHKDCINVELFIAIHNVFKMVKFSNASLALLNQTQTKKFDMQQINKKINHFGEFTKRVKDLLLEDVPLEAIGFVYNLHSNDPKASGEVSIQAEIANEKHIIKVFLKDENYGLAIEAHKLGRNVRIKGIAKQAKENYYIKEAEEFEYA